MYVIFWSWLRPRSYRWCFHALGNPTEHLPWPESSAICHPHGTSTYGPAATPAPLYRSRFLFLLFSPNYCVRAYIRVILANSNDSRSMGTGQIVAIIEDRCLNDPIFKLPSLDSSSNGNAAEQGSTDAPSAAGSLVRWSLCVRNPLYASFDASFSPPAHVIPKLKRRNKFLYSCTGRPARCTPVHFGARRSTAVHGLLFVVLVKMETPCAGVSLAGTGVFDHGVGCAEDLSSASQTGLFLQWKGLQLPCFYGAEIRVFLHIFGSKLLPKTDMRGGWDCCWAELT